MEDVAVKAGFASLKNGAEYDNLYAAASCRERADWLVGLNCTRLFTVLYGTTLNTDRVQSPTLAMLVKREADIDGFVKEPFYTPTLDLSAFTASGEKHKEKSEADAIAAACEGQNATITSVECNTKSVAPPKLYDLTSLQRDANRKLGYTAQQTLDYVQSLYEKKVVSYPRTDSKFISDDMRDTVQKIVGNIGFEPDIDRIVGKVSDHHAIIPTLESRDIDISAFPVGEREIYAIVNNRLTANTTKQASEPLGVCPRCGSAVREFNNGFFCDNRTCFFKLWKKSKFWTAKKRPLTAAIVTALLNDGRIAMTGLYSEKTGRKYDATVVLNDSGEGFVNFKIEFNVGRAIK